MAIELYESPAHALAMHFKVILSDNMNGCFLNIASSVYFNRHDVYLLCMPDGTGALNLPQTVYAGPTIDGSLGWA